MATYTGNFGLEKPDYNENYDVDVFNDNADIVDTALAGTQGMIAPAFSDAVTYAVGDMVAHDSHLYKCTTAHTGAWDATHFTQTSLVAELIAAMGV